MSDLMADKTVEFLREAANYFANRPTNGEDRAYWANVYNSEKCIKAADEIEHLRKEIKEVDDDWNMLRDKYDMLVIENMDLKKRIAHLEKVAADASWTAEMYRDQIDDRPKW